MLPWLYFLKDDEQLLIESPTARRVRNGPAIAYSGPFEKVMRRNGICVGPTDYVRVRNKLSGELHNVCGPTFFFLEANEILDQTLSVTPLKANEYMKVVNEQTGAITVVRGETTVTLKPTESALTEVLVGIAIDEHTAVVVRDIRSGELSLVETQQLFIPGADQEIVEKRQRILLEDHQAVVIKDREGRYQLRTGRDQCRSFFLSPFESLVLFKWSTGIFKEKRDLEFTHLDTRPKFMWYAFVVRTQDNVELKLGITVFWQVVDIQAMLKSTDDAPGDLCSHARSAIIQAVSKQPLEDFLQSLNEIVASGVMRHDDNFYAERGICLHAVEVRSVECQDEKTQKVLQEIIQETTNRLNRIAKQESENEISLSRVDGAIKAENARGELIAIQQKNALQEAHTAGAAEAMKITTFWQGLGDMSVEDKRTVFLTLRKQDMLADVAKGNAQIYFTPEQASLSIESQAAAHAGHSKVRV